MISSLISRRELAGFSVNLFSPPGLDGGMQPLCYVRNEPWLLPHLQLYCLCPISPYHCLCHCLCQPLTDQPIHCPIDTTPVV